MRLKFGSLSLLDHQNMPKPIPHCSNFIKIIFLKKGQFKNLSTNKYLMSRPHVGLLHRNLSWPFTFIILLTRTGVHMGPLHWNWSWSSTLTFLFMWILLISNCLTLFFETERLELLNAQNSFTIRAWRYWWLVCWWYCFLSAKLPTLYLPLPQLGFHSST